MQLLGALYRRLPIRWRRGSAYVGFEALAAASEAWDVDEMQRFQLKELRRLLHYANQHLPFYQRRFAEAGFQPEYVTDYAQLAGCPFLEDDDLAGLSAEAGGRGDLRAGDAGSAARAAAFEENLWRRAGYREGARLAVLTDASPAGSGSEVRGSYSVWRNRLILAVPSLAGRRTPPGLGLLRDFGPEFLVAAPEGLRLLARLLEGEGLSGALPLRAVLCGPGPLALEAKAQLGAVFGCRVFRWYRSPEGEVLAAEGVDADRFYFAPHHGYVEFGPLGADGWREIIGTPFHGSGLPLIRRRTGHYARVVQHPPEGLSLGADAEFAWSAAEDIR